jgi:hypothetical protein
VNGKKAWIEYGINKYRKMRKEKEVERKNGEKKDKKNQNAEKEEEKKRKIRMDWRERKRYGKCLFFFS